MILRLNKPVKKCPICGTPGHYRKTCPCRNCPEVEHNNCRRPRVQQWSACQWLTQAWQQLSLQQMPWKWPSGEWLSSPHSSRTRVCSICGVSGHYCRTCRSCRKVDHRNCRKQKKSHDWKLGLLSLYNTTLSIIWSFIKICCVIILAISVSLTLYIFICVPFAYVTPRGGQVRYFSSAID